MTAAAARKLQKDIEVALKKVEDGLEEFDYVWEQATTSSNGGQKEKLGEELKKSINKLQRLRVQIREWIGSSEVKQNFKDKLEESRKRIENDMKRFKEFERDMKTKAFSACALAKDDELNLEETEKRQVQEWCVDTITKFNEQVEEFEADVELLQNKKSLNGEEKERQITLKTVMERHRWHTKKLELVLRGLDNDSVEVTDLMCVKESVEVYLDMQMDMDYPHDEMLYDCFDLHEYEIQVKEVRTPSHDVKEDGDTPVVESKQKVKEKDRKKKDDKKEKKKEDKKASATTPQNGSGSTSNKAGGPADRSAERIPEEIKEKTRLEELAEEECKVQADQLLLGGEAEEFVCKICQTHVVGCEPTLTNCSHLFCGDCLNQWFDAHPVSQSWAQRAKSAGNDGRCVPCPVCKQPLNEKRDLYPVCGATSRSENLLLWRMLSSLKIMCINHSRMRSDGKCDWIGEYGQYQKHIKACERIQEGLSPLASPAASTPGASAAVLTLASAVAPARGPSETRRPDDTTEAEKSSTPGTGAPERSPHGAPTLSPVVAKMPSAKPDHSPKASPPPAAVQAQHVASRLATGPVKTAPVAAPVVIPQEVKAAPSSNAGAFLLPMADESHADAVEAAAPTKIQSPAPASSASASIPQVQQQAPVQPPAQSALTQPRKAPSSSQEPDGSFVAQATSAFEPNGPNMVPCQVGDSIHVLERHGSGWTYCKNLSLGGNSATGWAPSWIIQAAAADEAQRAAAAKRKEHEAAQVASAAVAPAAVHQVKAQESPALPAQQPANKVELHRSVGQPAVAAAPTPQHGPSAQAQAAVAAAAAAPLPVAPKAPSTVVRVATAGFAGTSASQLTVNTGDLVEIVESHASGWTYGRKVHAQASFGAVEGWFPDWVCAQK